jgi:hypothetical protein
MTSLIANKKSKVYHNSSCYFGNLILKENRVDLDSNFQDSKNNSYRSCSKCLRTNINHLASDNTKLDDFDLEFLKLRKNNQAVSKVVVWFNY